MGNPLFARKPLETLLKEAGDTGEHSLKRSLGPVNLIMLGIGAIIGAGLFVRTAAAIADRAGPSVLAGLHCGGSRLCLCRVVLCRVCVDDSGGRKRLYLFVRHHGRARRLDHRLGSGAGVRRGRSHGRRRLERIRESRVGLVWHAHSLRIKPLAARENGGNRDARRHNFPAFFILLLLTALLIKGTKESAFVNGFIVILKVTIVIVVISVGWGFINPANHQPFVPPPMDM